MATIYYLLILNKGKTIKKTEQNVSSYTGWWFFIVSKKFPIESSRAKHVPSCWKTLIYEWKIGM